MNVRNSGTGVDAGLTGPLLATRTAVWPSRSYARQVATLQRRIGQPIYIVELTFNGLAVGAVFHGEPRVLLDVVAFPRPDPSNHLYPHMLVLDDGRGINLGRIRKLNNPPVEFFLTALLFAGLGFPIIYPTLAFFYVVYSDWLSKKESALNSLSSAGVSNGADHAQLPPLPNVQGGIDFNVNLDNIRIIESEDQRNSGPWEPVINLQHFRQFNLKLIRFERANENEALSYLGIKTAPVQLGKLGN